MPEIIKEIADKVIATMRIDKVNFGTAYNSVYYGGYQLLDYRATKSAVGSELGKRKKKRNPKTSPPPTAKQRELDLGVSRAEAMREYQIREAAAHEASLTAGLPDHDL